MFYAHKDLPQVVAKLIDQLLDEDLTFPHGSSQKAAKELLERAIKIGKEQSFKEALKFWKDHPTVPQEIFWQWFNPVFLPEEQKKPVGTKKSKAGKKRK
jgi:hypothetical protein